MPDNEISTSTLLQRLFKTASISRFVKYYNKQMTVVPLDSYLAELSRSRNTLPEHVIKKSGIERTYGHQLFNGRRNPSRDKVIQLAFGFEMDYNEAQEFLKVARKNALYPKIKRDAAIIYALKHKFGVLDVQTTLNDLGLPLLGKEDRYE